MTGLMLVGKKTKPAGAAHTWRMDEGRLNIYTLIRSYKSTPSLSSFLPTVLIGYLYHAHHTRVLNRTPHFCFHPTLACPVH